MFINQPLFSLYFFVIIYSASSHIFAQANPVYIKSQSYADIRFNPVKKAPAQVTGLSTTTLSAEISSIIDSVDVLPGDKVKKGDILIQLNCDDASFSLKELKALINIAKANLALKQYQLARSKKLYKSKNISELDLKSDLTEVKVLNANISSIQAKIQLAQKNISRCNIISPFTGVVIERMINLGEMVTMGQQLITVTDPKHLELVVQLPMGLVDNFSISQTIKKSMFVYRGSKYPLAFRAKLPSVAGRARHQQFHFSFIADSDISLPPLNAFGELEVMLGDDFLPANLLVTRKGKQGIFLLIKNKAVFYPIDKAKPGRPFKVLPINGTQMLTHSSQIIVQGMQALTDGQQVEQLN